MTAFSYLALDNKGKQKKGVVESDSARAARAQLRDKGLSPLQVDVVSEKKTTNGKERRFSFRRRLSANDLALVTRQMATLLVAGIPIDEMLGAVAEQAEKTAIKTVLLGVRSKVLEGHSLADSMSNFPSAFPKLYRTSIAAGEHSGKLDTILLKLAEFTERQHHVRQKVRQALLYPSLMTMVSIAIVVFLLVNVVPKIIGVFTDTHQILPMATIVLIKISHVVKNEGWYMLLGFVLLIYGFSMALRRPAFRKTVDHILLKTPLIGKAIKTVNAARFGRTLGILTASSVPVLEAMEAATQLVVLVPMKEALVKAKQEVREGQRIYQALKQSGYFAPMFIHLVASGESSGQLESMLEKAANYLETDMEAFIQNVLTLFEPCMILVMGGVVLFIVLAIMLPIFSLDQIGSQL